MSDDKRASYNGQPAYKPVVHRPGELLYKFLKGHTRIRCELRDQGQCGWEAIILHNEELVIGRTFHQRLDPNRTSRDMAIAWATEERAAIEGGNRE